MVRWAGFRQVLVWQHQSSYLDLAVWYYLWIGRRQCYLAGLSVSFSLPGTMLVRCQINQINILTLRTRHNVRPLYDCLLSTGFHLCPKHSRWWFDGSEINICTKIINITLLTILYRCWPLWRLGKLLRRYLNIGEKHPTCKIFIDECTLQTDQLPLLLKSMAVKRARKSE